MTNTASPGWYPHPDNPALEYWWDGTQYTQSRAVPVLPPAPPAPPVVAAPQTELATTASVAATYTAPPAYVAAPVPYERLAAARISPKSRTVASILGFFLGGLGVDRFYLGNIGLGVAKLLVGWLTFGLWPLIDWIIILSGGARDGDGLPVTNWG